MQLGMLIRNLNSQAITGSTDREIVSLCYDSRRAREGSLFFALRGEVADGHRFVPQVLEKKAAAGEESG